MLELHSEMYTVTIYDESEGDGPARPPAHDYDRVLKLGDADFFILMPRYGVVGGLLGGPTQSLLIHAEGQPTRLREHSALICANLCVVAIGAYVVALRLPSLDPAWYAPADLCDSCNGVYHAPHHQRLIVRGECEITCFSYAGDDLWSFAGRDVFMDGLKVYQNYVEAIDFNDTVYRIDLTTGRETLIGQQGE
jgi:hypothetical protein